MNDELGTRARTISDTLFEELLRKRRILVIIDHLSEMSEQMHQLIHPEMPEWSIKAFIVTSRNRESLGHLAKTTIQPLRIEGDRLSSFMENYLRQVGKRELFTDQEFFYHCTQLSRVVGQGNITVLLARLYCDQMIHVKEKSARAFPAVIADNIPDLMLSYLNTLNRDIKENKLDDRKVHRAAKILAWECLKETYNPITVRRQAAIKALGCEEAEQYLEYLEERLHLIQIIGPGKDRIRFALDPISEYLAALHLLELYSDDESKWADFLQQFDNIPEDFLGTLRDCCIAKGKEVGIPKSIVDKLSQVDSKPIQISSSLAR